MDIKIILGLMSLAGVILSALLSSTAYFYKHYAEIKKSKRHLLFLLLEIRNSLNISWMDPLEITHEYIHFF
ncbi:MAG: hypothetical protein AAGB12_15820, partial [Pseudomonadota bacterium]